MVMTPSAAVSFLLLLPLSICSFHFNVPTVGPIIQQVAQSTHRLSSSLAALCNKLKHGPHGILCRMEPPAVNDGNVTRRHDSYGEK
jgi:hypothetical protein